MKMKWTSTVMALAIAAMLVPCGLANAGIVDDGDSIVIGVDGIPNDWLGFTFHPSWGNSPAGQLAVIDGLSTPGGAGNNYAFDSLVGNAWFQQHVEDGPDPVLGPGGGGQDFDMEAMYGYYENDTMFRAGNPDAEFPGMYVGIFTGFDPLGEGAGQGEFVSSTPYFAGDIFFDFGVDGLWDLAIETTTTGGNQGTVYGPSGWTGGVPNEQTWWDNPNPYVVAAPATINGTATNWSAWFAGTAGAASYSDRDATDHNFIEAVLYEDFLEAGMLAFGWDVAEGTPNSPNYMLIHWTETCGNDVGDIEVPSGVPEPMSMVMLGCLGAGMLGARRVTRRKKS